MWSQAAICKSTDVRTGLGSFYFPNDGEMGLFAAIPPRLKLQFLQFLLPSVDIS